MLDLEIARKAVSMKHKERARKKRLQKQERDSLVKQLTPYEMKIYQKNRWKIFRTSYFESLGCGCLLAPIISFLVVFLGIPQRILSEEKKFPAFIIFILFFSDCCAHFVNLGQPV